MPRRLEGYYNTMPCKITAISPSSRSWAVACARTSVVRLNKLPTRLRPGRGSAVRRAALCQPRLGCCGGLGIQH